MSKVKEYSNEEITVVWKPELCIHSEKCVKGLPSVFDMNAKPWINVDGAQNADIIDQVGKCPSGALTMKSEDEQNTNDTNQATKVEVSKNGPLLVHGDLMIQNSAGEDTFKKNMTAFCRCGASENKPYCDGSHKKIDFKD